VESSSANLVQTEEGFQPVFFDPRPLKNLLLVDELPSLMPILDMKVGKLPLLRACHCPDCSALPHAHLGHEGGEKDLLLVDELPSLMPILDMKVGTSRGKRCEQR